MILAVLSAVLFCVPGFSEGTEPVFIPESDDAGVDAKQAESYAPAPVITYRLSESGSVYITNRFHGFSGALHCKDRFPEDLVLPETVDGRPLTEIGGSAFSQFGRLVSVTVPGTVRTIGNNAFFACKGLKAVHLQEGLRKIDYRAFQGCTSLEKVEIPEGVTEIGEYAFDYCPALTLISIPRSVKNIGFGALGARDQFGKDKNRDIKARVYKGSYAEEFCSRYKIRYEYFPEVKVSAEDAGEFFFFPEDGEGLSRARDILCAMDPKKTVLTYTLDPQGNAVIKNTVWDEAGGNTLTTAVIIPETVDGHPVTEIGNGAFSHWTELIYVSLPDSIVRIGDYAFGGRLVNIRMPAGLKEIGEYAFAGLPLDSVDLPDGLETVGAGAFYNCGYLRSAAIPESVRFIGENAFGGARGLKASVAKGSRGEQYCLENGVSYEYAQKETAAEPVPAETPEWMKLAGVWERFRYKKQGFILSGDTWTWIRDGRTWKVLFDEQNPAVYEKQKNTVSVADRADGGYTVYRYRLENDRLFLRIHDFYMDGQGEIQYHHWDETEAYWEETEYHRTRSLALPCAPAELQEQSGFLFRKGVRWYMNGDEVKQHEKGRTPDSPAAPGTVSYMAADFYENGEAGLEYHFSADDELLMAFYTRYSPTGDYLNKIKLDLMEDYGAASMAESGEPLAYCQFMNPGMDLSGISVYENPIAWTTEDGTKICLLLLNTRAADTGNGVELYIIYISPKLRAMVESGENAGTIQPVVTATPTPAPTAAPTSPPAPRAAGVTEIKLYGSLPENHSLNQLNEDMKVGFTLTLCSDGSAKLDEGYPEGYFNYHGSWSCSGGKLKLKMDSKSTALEQTVTISGSTARFVYFGETIRRELKESELSFLEEYSAGTNSTPDPDRQEASPVTAEPAPAPSPVPASTEPEEVAPGVVSVPVSRVEASSWIEGKKPDAYKPFRMTDGSEHTAWQFSTKKSRLKETYAYFYFDEPQEIDALWIKNGFWTVTEGLDQYTRNSRVKELGIAFRYEGSDDWTDKRTEKLPDDKKRKDWQKVSLGSHSRVTGIRFRIMSIYKGKKFPKDVCISEVMFVRSGK